MKIQKKPNQKRLPLALSLILCTTAMSNANDIYDHEIHYDKNSSPIIAPSFNGFAGQMDSTQVIVNSTPENLQQIAGYIPDNSYDKYSTRHNSVILKSGSASSIYGAYINAIDSHINSDYNSVIISDNHDNKINQIYGSYGVTNSHSSLAFSNSIHIKNSTIKNQNSDGLIAGSLTLSRQGQGETMGGNNKVIIDDSTIISNIYGAISIDGRTELDAYSWHSAGNNTIEINNSSITGNLFGSYLYQESKKDYLSASLRANENTITLNNSTLNGDIYGGYTQSYVVPEAIQVHLDSNHNTVIISGNTKVSQGGKLTSIYGGYIDYQGPSPEEGNVYDYDAFTKNHFIYQNDNSLRLGTLKNFEMYTFYINKDTYTEPLITADLIDLTADNPYEKKYSTIRVAGIKSGEQLNIGDQFILMHASELIGKDGVTFETLDNTRYFTQRALQGFAFVYDLGIMVDLDSKTVSATVVDPNNPTIPKIDIDPVKPFDPTDPVDPVDPVDPITPTPGGKVNPQLKSLSEGYLAGAALTNRGADLLVSEVLTQSHDLIGYQSIAAMKASYTRYDSGSHIKSKDFNAILGGSVTFDNNVTVGAFFEGGTSDYDTYNTFQRDGDIRGNGDSNFFGLGLFTKYQDNNGFFAEFSLRGGKSKTSFKSDTFVSGDGLLANYKVKPSYFGTHVGAGYEWKTTDQLAFNVGARYFYSEVKGKDFMLGNDPIHFDKVKSSRARITAGLSNVFSNETTITADIGYEYEFDGRVDGKTHTVHAIDAPSIKGGSALLNLGVDYVPSSAKNLTLNANIEGYAGKRRGGSFGLKMTYFYQKDAK